MCEICRQTPCNPRCPNHENKIIGYCEWCNKPLYEDYVNYTDNNGNNFCSEDCAEKYYGIKEKD